jgi:hypothetical protein
MAGPRCSVCRSPAGSHVEALISSGTSIRAVARLTGLGRGAVARHRDHTQPALLPETPEERGAVVDPMAAALELVKSAKTERQKMKALEAVRGASWLALRSLGGEPDADLLEQLDANVGQAASMFREVEGFESQLYGLSGVREAIRQRLAATQKTEQIETLMTVTMADGTPRGDPIPYRISLAEHFRGVPARFKDRDRYDVQRVINLKWPNSPIADERPDEEIRVYEIATSALVWASRS